MSIYAKTKRSEALHQAVESNNPSGAKCQTSKLVNRRSGTKWKFEYLTPSAWKIQVPDEELARHGWLSNDQAPDLSQCLCSYKFVLKNDPNRCSALHSHLQTFNEDFSLSCSRFETPASDSVHPFWWHKPQYQTNMEWKLRCNWQLLFTIEYAKTTTLQLFFRWVYRSYSYSESVSVLNRLK